MTIPFILLLILAATGLLITKRTKSAITIYSIATLLFFFIGSGFLPSLLLPHLAYTYTPLSNPHWQKHNIIIVLGNGTVKIPANNAVVPTLFSFSRIYETARLYYSCKKSGEKCSIIISGGDPLANGIPEAIVYQDALINLGIQKSDIEAEARSKNTFQNAKLTSELLKAQTYDRLLLVTSGIHTKRSLLYFSYFGIHPAPAPSDVIAVNTGLIPSTYHFTVTDFIIHEYIGIARFYIYNYMGWNK